MEQELAEALKQREEEKQQRVGEASRAEAETAALRSSLEASERQIESHLASSREAERLSQEALEQEKLQVARLENEVLQMKEEKLASLEASERDGAELARLEKELAFMRDAGDRACQDATERGKLEVEELEQQLLKTREDTQKKEEILALVWRHLQPLAAEDDPADLPLLLGTQLTRLTEERGEAQKRCDELTHTVENLRGEKLRLIYRTTDVDGNL